MFELLPEGGKLCCKCYLLLLLLMKLMKLLFGGRLAGKV